MFGGPYSCFEVRANQGRFAFDLLETRLAVYS